MFLYKSIGPRILKAEIFRVFSLTAVSTFIKMLTGFVSTKIVSLLVGPAGIALIGQLQNFTTIVLTVSNGGISNGIIKYVAEFRNSKERLKEYISTAYTITLLCSLLCAIFMLCANTWLSEAIFNDQSYYYVFVIFGISIILYSLNLLLISILNGFQQFRKYVVVNISGSVIGMFFTIALVIIMGISGALIGLVTYQSVLVVVTILLIRHEPWLNKSLFYINLNKYATLSYVRFSVMAAVTAITLPIVQMVLRKYIISKMSIDVAGYWEGMNRLSTAYLVFVSSSFAVYYLPKISECKTSLAIQKEIKKVSIIILPFILVLFVFIYLFRIQIINILYSEEFMPMSDFFVPQLFGDFVKISSWCLSYILLAKSMMKTYVFLEIFSPIVFLALSYKLIDYYGVLGVIYSYDISILLYLIFLLFIFRKLIIPYYNGK